MDSQSAAGQVSGSAGGNARGERAAYAVFAWLAAESNVDFGSVVKE